MDVLVLSLAFSQLASPHIIESDRLFFRVRRHVSRSRNPPFPRSTMKEEEGGAYQLTRDVTGTERRIMRRQSPCSPQSIMKWVSVKVDCKIYHIRLSASYRFSLSLFIRVSGIALSYRRVLRPGFGRRGRPPATKGLLDTLWDIEFWETKGLGVRLDKPSLYAPPDLRGVCDSMVAAWDLHKQTE